MIRLPAVQSSHDPEGKAFEVCIFSADFKKVFIPQVDTATLRKMKDRTDKYSWVGWVALPEHALKAEEVQSEKELRHG